MPKPGESQTGGRERIPLDAGPVASSMWLRVDARRRNLPTIAAVATGAAEALELDVEPATRLRTISIEAAGNAIAHAYPEAHGGPLEIQIAAEDPGPNQVERRVHVRVHDDGVGIVLPPLGGDPPGLGMPIISSLADRFTVRSGVEGGTTVDATIIPGADPDHPGSRAPPAVADSYLLDFGDRSFLRPVIGRALAAQVTGEGADFDLLSQAILVGDAIAESLEPLDRNSPRLPRLEISRWREARQIRISIGPLLASATGRLTGGIRSALSSPAPGLGISIEAGAGGSAMALITLPI